MLLNSMSDEGETCVSESVGDLSDDSLELDPDLQKIKGERIHHQSM